MAPIVAALILLASALQTAAQSSTTLSSSASASASSGSAIASGSAATASSTASAITPFGTSPAGGESVQNVTILATVGAQANSSQLANNATLQGVWSTDTSRGTLAQGMALLQNSTATAQNQSVLGVLVSYNETSALANANASVTTSIPWIALISCDSPATQQFSLPADSANSTLAAFENSTAIVPVNVTAAANGTTTTTASQANYIASVFGQAASQGAQAVLLYSLQQQSCSLNYTALNGTNSSFPIWSTPKLAIAQTVVGQFNNIASDHRYFNASLLNEATANLSTLISNNEGANASTLRLTMASYFVLARLAPYFNPNDTNNGVVATIGRNPTATASQTATTSTGSVAPTSSSGMGGGDSSGAVAGRRGLAVSGLVAVGLATGIGLLVV